MDNTSRYLAQVHPYLRRHLCADPADLAELLSEFYPVTVDDINQWRADYRQNTSNRDRVGLEIMPDEIDYAKALFADMHRHGIEPKHIAPRVSERIMRGTMTPSRLSMVVGTVPKPGRTVFTVEIDYGILTSALEDLSPKERSRAYALRSMLSTGLSDEESADTGAETMADTETFIAGSDMPAPPRPSSSPVEPVEDDVEASFPLGPGVKITIGTSRQDRIILHAEKGTHEIDSGTLTSLIRRAQMAQAIVQGLEGES